MTAIELEKDFYTYDEIAHKLSYSSITRLSSFYF